MVMVVTMIHHAYGAWAYDAPWRRHVVPVAAALIAAMMVLARFGNAPSARAALVALVVIAPLGWIGLFVGIYNHAAKLLHYAGDPQIERASCREGVGRDGSVWVVPVTFKNT